MINISVVLSLVILTDHFTTIQVHNGLKKKRENIFSLMNATNCTDKTKLGLSQQKTYGGALFFLYTGTQTITFASGATNFSPTPPPIQLRKQQFPTQEFILV